MSKHVGFNKTSVVNNVSTTSSPVQVESSSGVTSQSDSAPTPSSSSSRDRRSSPRLDKTVTFADPLESVVPSSPSPDVPVSPPPSTRNLRLSASTNSIPSGGKKKQRRRARGGFLNSRQQKSLRRRGFGHQPNSPVTIGRLLGISARLSRFWALILILLPTHGAQPKLGVCPMASFTSKRCLGKWVA